MHEALAIISVGACSCAGLDAEQSAATIAAGVMRKSESDLFDRYHDPIVLGHLPLEVLPPLAPALEASSSQLIALEQRMLRLAGPALQEVLAAVDGPPVPVYLAGPQPRPGKIEIMGDGFLGCLAQQAGAELELATSGLFRTGRAGLFAAIEAASARLMAEGGGEFVIVGGVDSFYDSYRLSVLDAAGRLAGMSPRDAATPGEAAAFICLARAQTCRRRGIAPLAWIGGVGQAVEPGHVYADEPHLGTGLGAALQDCFARSSIPLEPVRLVFSGINGESRFNKDWGVAWTRNQTQFAGEVRIEHVAECIGDAGAALAPTMLVVAAVWLHRQQAHGPALAWACSDQGSCGSLLLTGEQGG